MRGFSSMLLALLVTALVAVAVAVPSLYILTTRATHAAHTAVADSIAGELRNAPPGEDPAATLERVRRSYPDVTITLEPQRLQPHSTDSAEYRSLNGRTIEALFPDTLGATRRLFRFAAMAAAIAVIAAVSLLVLNILSLMGSRGARGQSTAEQATPSQRAYLLDTFESSIRTLKYRESELARMHKDEKARANALASVTATLVRSLASGFVSFDDSGHVIDLNQSARDLLGASSTPIRPRMRITDLVDNPFSRAVRETVEQRLPLHRQELEDPASRTVIDLTTVPLVDERGHFFGMLALVSDLTPMRRLETSVREMETLAALGEMSAGIAHEFRNSLSTIIGYLRLAKKTPLTPEAASRVERAEDEARLLAEAIESLLSFARPVELQRQPVDVLALASDVASRNAAQVAGIQVEVTGEPLVIDGDPVLLRRALENLMRNAADAIQAKGGGGGSIRVSSSAADRRLTIADDGAGLQPEIAGRLFLPFQSTKAQGFGLGLALVRKIIVLHGGTVSLKGGPGEGATATIEFGPVLPAVPIGSARGRTVTFHHSS